MDYFILFKNIGYIVVILTFIKVVYEYVMAMKWKKAEFLSKEVKEFFSDSTVKVICTLLDYNIRKVEIEGKKVVISDREIIDALQTHQVKQSFSTQEGILRDMFDLFFDKLSNFNIHIKNGLVEEKQVLAYFCYYLDIISKPGRKPKELLKTFSNYIDFYGFENVKELIESNNTKNISFLQKTKSYFIKHLNLRD